MSVCFSFDRVHPNNGSLKGAYAMTEVKKILGF